MYQAGSLESKCILVSTYFSVFLMHWIKRKQLCSGGSIGRLLSWFSSAGKPDYFTLEIYALNFFPLLFYCISRSLLFHNPSPAPSGSMDALPQKLNTSCSESRAQVNHNSPIPVGRIKCSGEPFWVPPGIVPLPLTRNNYSQNTLCGSYGGYMWCFALGGTGSYSSMYRACSELREASFSRTVPEPTCKTFDIS